jgi:hypothetical protein
MSDNPFIYAAFLILLIFFTMYAARKPFLRAILRLSRLVYNSMRLSSTSVKLAEKRLHLRNRTVLVGSELEAGERRIEREFERLGHEFQHNVKGFSQIQRKLMEDLIKGEEDYQNCAEVPQVLPDWGKVIDAVAKIKPSGDPAVADILELIHHTLIEQHKSALERHRRSVSERHALLGKMVPFWRNVQKTMRGVETKMAELHQRSKKIDRYMEEHEKVLKRADAVERLRTSSTLVKFFISSVLLAVAALAAVVNYNLIAMPMGELVGVDSYIGSVKMSDLYTFIIVGLEVIIGLFIMDALRVTRFSVVGSMEERKRRWALVILCFSLLLLVLLEIVLALLWERTATQMMELQQTLSGESSPVMTGKVAMIGQMIMGFILPLLLTFVAIPLETFISSMRSITGMVAEWSLRALAFLLRLLGNLATQAGKMAINIYDLVIFPALWLERTMTRRSTQEQAMQEEASGKA